MDDLEPTRNFWRVVIAWFLPPVGVALKRGFGIHFWLSCALSLFFWLPGMVHAMWIVSADRYGRTRARTFWSLAATLVFPPLGVFLRVGIAPAFWLNLLFTFFFWFPGAIHAVWTISTHEE